MYLLAGWVSFNSRCFARTCYQLWNVKKRNKNTCRSAYMFESKKKHHGCKTISFKHKSRNFGIIDVWLMYVVPYETVILLGDSDTAHETSHQLWWRKRLILMFNINPMRIACWLVKWNIQSCYEPIREYVKKSASLLCKMLKALPWLAKQVNISCYEPIRNGVRRPVVPRFNIYTEAIVIVKKNEIPLMFCRNVWKQMFSDSYVIKGLWNADELIVDILASDILSKFGHSKIHVGRRYFSLLCDGIPAL